MKHFILPAIAALVLFSSGSRRAAAAPLSPRQQAAQEFQDDKFGMFIHWGVYAVLGHGEWVMNNEKISVAEYEKLPGQFNPVRFDAEEWVELVKAAGMKYITITAKHHDGFCMYHSRLTRYNVVDATPSKRDVIGELAAACHKHGVKLFFYYSLLDWHHPDYYPRGRTGHATGRPERGAWKNYVAYYQGQVRELCSHYGAIGGIWFDGWWDRPEADWDMAGTYRIIHDLQPKALVGNNHHREPLAGEDFQMFEQDLPGQNKSGFNRASTAALPLETCLTMNNSWGYNANDHGYKSFEQLVGYLVGAAGRNANLLLNVGPRPDGTIPPEFQERLHQVGKWLHANGAAIYGTRGGPFPPADWGVSTSKDDTVYLHVLKYPAGGRISLLSDTLMISTAKILGDGKLAAQANGKAIRLSLPSPPSNSPDLIVVLQSQKPLTSRENAR